MNGWLAERTRQAARIAAIQVRVSARYGVLCTWAVAVARAAVTTPQVHELGTWYLLHILGNVDIRTGSRA
jgi:hypothetical protein